MKNDNIFKFVNGLNNIIPEKNQQNKFESDCSLKITELINSDELVHLDLPDMRMLTVAHSLFDSGSFSLFDDDICLDEFLSHVFMIKTKAHIPAFEASFKELQENGHKSKDSAICLQSDIHSFSIESNSTRKYESSTLCKSVVYFDKNLHSIVITGFYRGDKLIKLISFPLNFLTLKNNEKIINEINDIDFSKITFHLDIDYRLGAKMTLNSLNKTKYALGALNHTSSCLGLNVSFNL